ncbi:hypothetical protein E4U51_005671 [Claviceps purpurea]|nr:hypothetical protein E4U51_005671 [Claviceps purpurea]
MVKILSIFMATLAAISPVVQARACIPGNNYCGSTLTTFGKQLSLSDESILRRLNLQLLMCSGPLAYLYYCILGFSTASDLISDALYNCQDDGTVKLLHKCDGVPCIDGTAGLSDYCFS